MEEIGEEKMNITEQEMEFICDELCRHPRECQDQQELDEICKRCPMAEKAGRINNGFRTECN